MGSRVPKLRRTLEMLRLVTLAVRKCVTIEQRIRQIVKTEQIKGHRERLSFPTGQYFAKVENGIEVDCAS